MRLYRVKRFGDVSGLTLIEEPDPAAPKGRQVLVRIRASALNFRDLMGLRGQLAHFGGMPLNHIPLCDGAGEVVAVGPLVGRVKPGDRVALTFHPTWIGGEYEPNLNILGRSSGLNDGCLAEYTVVDESEVVHSASSLNDEEMATLPCAGVTAWFAIHGSRRFLPGNSVLIQGTGGVSLFALQIAKLSGARVIATTTHRTKMAALSKFGADAVIDASEGIEWVSEVLKATDGVGADLTIEVGGAETFDKSAAATRRGGHISLVGVLSGLPVSQDAMYFLRGLSVQPTRVGSREHFEQLIRAVSVGHLNPVIDRVYDFEQAPEAFSRLAEGGHMGKIVIRHN